MRRLSILSGLVLGTKGAGEAPVGRRRCRQPPLRTVMQTPPEGPRHGKLSQKSEWEKYKIKKTRVAESRRRIEKVVEAAVETALFLELFLPIGGKSSITRMGFYGFYNSPRYISITIFDLDQLKTGIFKFARIVSRSLWLNPR